MSYSAQPRTVDTPTGPVEIDTFAVEYAEVYGIPFSFIQASGGPVDPKPGPLPTRVRSLADRIAHEITFPRIDGYRYELPAERLPTDLAWEPEDRLALTTADVPTRVQCDPIVGESCVHTLDELRSLRIQQVAFVVARRVMEQYFCDDEGCKVWLFPDVLTITRRWLDEAVTLKDGTFKQLLLLTEKSHDAADRIYKAIVRADAEQTGQKRLMPIPKPYDTVGSTSHVSFDTVRPTYKTDPSKCHISHVVCDTESWEQKMAQTFEDMPEVVSYAKNHNLQFFIPYTLNGQQRNYIPDFLVRFDDGHGPDDLLTLIVESSGQRDKEKEAKTSTAQNLWVPAVNNASTWGRWAFIEISDPWDAANTIRAAIPQTVAV